MKAIPAALLADLKADCTTLAFIWTIQKANGVMIRGTEHDRDITIPASGNSPADPYAGTYRAIANVTLGDIQSNPDLSIDNLEVNGAFPDKDDSPLMYTVIDVDIESIRSGALDMAPVCVMICNWAAPSHGYFEVKGGTLGQITRNTDQAYTTEVRGLTQQLAQTIIRTFSETCNVVKFGDLRCKFPVPTAYGHVVADTAGSKIQFGVDIEAASPPFNYSYVGGTLTFTSGANIGFFREVKVDPTTNNGIVQFWEEFGDIPSTGDEFEITPGCDRTWQTCKNTYNNLNNFRGFGLFIPGIMALTAGPTTVSELGS